MAGLGNKYKDHSVLLRYSFGKQGAIEGVGAPSWWKNILMVYVGWATLRT